MIAERSSVHAGVRVGLTPMPSGKPLSADGSKTTFPGLPAPNFVKPTTA